MQKLWILRPAHFFVDFACCYLCMGYAEENIQFFLLLYNFCAFALQMPFGLLVDRFGKQIKAAGVGAALTALSLLFPSNPLVGVLLAGVGNALFHVGGGVYVLQNCENKCTPLGQFVAPGALGLFFGGVFADEFNFLHPIVMFILLVFAAVFLFTKTQDATKTTDACLPVVEKKEGVAFVLLFLVVVLRSVAGFQFTFSWKTGVPAFLFAVGVMAGKELGGALSDRFGMMKTSLVSLIVGAVLFLFSGSSAVCGILAVLCFNCTMPVTLFAAFKIIRGLPGFSFGLLTFALFLGLLPSYFGFAVPDSAALFGVGACVVSLCLLLPGLQLAKTERDGA